MMGFDVLFPEDMEIVVFADCEQVLQFLAVFAAVDVGWVALFSEFVVVVEGAHIEGVHFVDERQLVICPKY